MSWLRIGSVLLTLAIALGAFGAHALRASLSVDAKAIYQTAVLYHLVTGVGLLAVGLVAAQRPGDRLITASGWALTIGVVLFSGSLYLLSVTGVKKFGMITPLGGLGLLGGWLLFAAAIR